MKYRNKLKGHDPYPEDYFDKKERLNFKLSVEKTFHTMLFTTILIPAWLFMYELNDFSKL